MTELVFVDTNVLVYSRDASEPKKQPAATAWRKELWRRNSGRLSVQVLSELYVTVTRKLVPGMTRDAAQAEIRDLAHWKPVSMSPHLLDAAFAAEKEHQLSFWDALIVAAAQEAGCRYLLSEDFNAGQDYGGVVAVNPFETAPEKLLGTAAT